MKFTPEIKAAVLKLSTRRELPRKATLLAQGDTSCHIYLVESGCIRMWLNEDGRDTSVQFFLAGDAVSSFQSFILEEPSPYSLEAVVASEVRQIEKTALRAHFERSPDFRDFIFQSLFLRLGEYQGLFVNAITLTSKERYEQMLQQRPELFDLVPQHYIASYLGMTPVTLSRIRRKIKNR